MNIPHQFFLTVRRVCRGALALLAATTLLGADAPKPNIVIILSDDQGWADVGWHGTEIKTPNLDRIAAAGATLEQFY